MSGYPYGSTGGGYPPQQYGGSNSGYPNYSQDSGFQLPPPIPTYSDNQSCASLYGTPAPMSNNYNYPSGPYDPYSGNPMPNPSYGMDSSGNYPPPFGGGPMPNQFGGRIGRKFLINC